MAMDSLITSLHGWYPHSWLMSTVLFLLLSTQCTGAQISYDDHCASFVPKSTTTDPEFASLPFSPLQNGYYAGGDRLLNPNQFEYAPPYNNILLFQTQHVYRTKSDGVFNVQGSLNLDSLNMNYFGHGMTYSHSVVSPMRTGDNGALSFSLKGFWSKSSGKLCMVGSSSSYSPEGNRLHHPAVLKLNGVKNSSTITSLVTGTLQSLSAASDPSYFNLISLLIFPQTNYQYTKVSKDIENECSGEGGVREDSLSLQVSTTICSIFASSQNIFELVYASECNSSKNCNPFDDAIGYMPRVMSLNMIHCSSDGQSLRFLLEFPNSSYASYYSYFNPNTTFLAEGSWEWKKNRLCVVACRILNTNVSLDNSHVEDCSTRLTLRFPAIWSIGESTSMLGQIWSQKAANDSGYFERIVFRSTDPDYNDILRVPGLKYEYTAAEKVRTLSSCSKKKPLKNSLGNYPDGLSQDMCFDMNVKKAERQIAWGSSVPISVGDQIFQLSEFSTSWSGSRAARAGVEANASSSKQLNISYKIILRPHYSVNFDGVKNLFNISSSENRRVEIFAEGIYDSETGGLCMVGCRYVGMKYQKSVNNSMDCDIRIQFQFPPLNAKNKAFIRGSIASSRNKSDALYFEPLSVSATAFFTIWERQSIWRMDLEIVMVLVSNTLACIFIVFQLLYVKKHPDALPFTSLLMLVILTLGHMSILVLNFEALFSQNDYRQTVLLGSGGWIKVHEVIVRVVTMVAFVLQFRLLQFSLSARMRDNNQKALWVSEKKALYASLPLYIVGAFITLFANWSKYKSGTQFFRFNNDQHSLWGDLRSYAGLILDGFLFPQILLNIFHHSREYTLSRFFYIGLTIVRLVPHAYDLYRAQNYIQDFDGSYIYADPAADFYSTTWDITIPLMGLLFAAIIYLQQRFGGRCFLPRRFRELEVYEKIPDDNQD